MLKRFLIVILLFLFFSQASIQAEIVFIPEREYFDIVHEELLNAKESIHYLEKMGLVKFEPYKGVIEVLDIEDDNYIHVPEEFWDKCNLVAFWANFWYK